MKKYTVRDLLQIKNGKDHKHLNEGNIPVYGSGGIMRFADESIFEGKSILLPRKGTLSNIQYVDEPFWTVDTIYYTVINEKLVEPFYLFNLLKLLDLSRLNSGTGVPSMTFDAYYDIPVYLPDLSYQRKVSSILKLLQDKIGLNNKINAELESLAKTIYDYWFVQFDFPDANGRPYKSSCGNMVYNDVLKREIPEGWEVKSIQDVSTLLTRGVSPTYIEEGGILVLNQKCIRNKTVDFSLARRHNNDLKPVKSKLIQKGDILVNSTGVGTLGRLAVVKWLSEEVVACDSHVTIIRLDRNAIESGYGQFALSERQGEIEKFGIGSTGQTELSREELGKVKVLIPNKSTQALFSNLIDPTYSKMAANEKENNELSSLRDWLLPMLMNGQVTVKDAYEQVEGALSMAAEE